MKPHPNPTGWVVRTALNAQRSWWREVVALRVVADLSTGETAELLDIRPGTVSAHLHRALAALRAALPAPAPQLSAREERP